MKKKIVVLLSLVLVMSILFCGCGESNSSASKATIVDNNGETVELSADELRAIYNENEVKFNKNYKTAQATIDGTVERVESSWRTFGSSTEAVYTIHLTEGWSVHVLQQFHEDVVDFSKGDKVHVVSTIQMPWGSEIELQHIGKRANEWWDGTEITLE